ncbi:hypothetical protein GWI33_005155 [Rhynchophorus ferrugineus]|uniref:Uncharacterized protein n=1 Tax=Rhynchophorus ferrugineus TaxID=354439 RepID=A0A834IWD3_RHYFE|nr:hypothetical protein GWI33_005155 [Rhynchophorus ferrugineus]
MVRCFRCSFYRPAKAGNYLKHQDFLNQMGDSAPGLEEAMPKKTRLVVPYIGHYNQEQRQSRKGLILNNVISVGIWNHNFSKKLNSTTEKVPENVNDVLVICDRDLDKQGERADRMIATNPRFEMYSARSSTEPLVLAISDSQD